MTTNSRQRGGERGGEAPLPNPYRLADAEAFIDERAPTQWRSGAGLVRVIEHLGEFAGVIDLRRTDWRTRSAEISYWVAPWARSRGMARTSLDLLTRFGIAQGMGRVEVRVATQNERSLATARACGYVEEGVLRRAGFTHTGIVDVVVLSRLSEDQAVPD